MYLKEEKFAFHIDVDQQNIYCVLHNDLTKELE